MASSNSFIKCCSLSLCFFVKLFFPKNAATSCSKLPSPVVFLSCCFSTARSYSIPIPKSYIRDDNQPVYWSENLFLKSYTMLRLWYFRTLVSKLKVLLLGFSFVFCFFIFGFGVYASNRKNIQERKEPVTTAVSSSESSSTKSESFDGLIKAVNNAIESAKN